MYDVNNEVLNCNLFRMIFLVCYICTLCRGCQSAFILVNKEFVSIGNTSFPCCNQYGYYSMSLTRHINQPLLSPFAVNQYCVFSGDNCNPKTLSLIEIESCHDEYDEGVFTYYAQ